MNGIGDIKSPGIYGFGARFFKVSRNVVKDDVVVAVKDLFENERLYKTFDSTLVTHIPKGDGAKTIRDYRPIAGRTIVYKIISKISIDRTRKVMRSIIS